MYAERGGGRWWNSLICSSTARFHFVYVKKNMLPDDIVTLIIEHKCAMRIQRAWRRYDRLSHSRLRAWPHVREALLFAGLLRELSSYYAVRREWRMEPESWMDMTPEGAATILNECRSGLWGP